MKNEYKNALIQFFASTGGHDLDQVCALLQKQIALEGTDFLSIFRDHIEQDLMSLSRYILEQAKGDNQ